MKKVLMGTTAIVAAGLLAAGPALAEEKEKVDPVRVGISGYAQHWVTYVNHDEVGGKDLSGFDTKQNAEIWFKGSTELDNGLTVGVDVHLEGQQDGLPEHLDKSFVTVGGAFGKFIVGGQDSVMSMMKTGPMDVGTIFPDDGYVGWFTSGGDIKAPGASHMRFAGDEQGQVTYMTPRINGLQIGVSYMPSMTAGKNTQPDRNSETTDIISGAVNYTHSLDNGSATVAATYGSGDDAGAGMNLSTRVSVAGVTVGASWGQTDDMAVDKTAYNVGVAYEAGPMSTGVNYFHGEYEDGSGQVDTVHASARWALGPGVSTAFTIGHTTYSADGAEDVEATYGVGGFKVNF